MDTFKEEYNFIHKICKIFASVTRYKFRRLTTGKNEKEYSWHVPAMKFIGMKQLV